MKDKTAERLLRILSFLRKKKITFRMEQQSDDAIMVSFALVGMRVEADVFEDRLEFSVFTGDESVESDESRLYALVNERWVDD
jgi:hypothetical protein